MRSRELIDSITAKRNETIELKKQKLEYIGSMAPYGYIIDKDTKKLIIDKNSCFIVYLIYSLFDMGYGFTYIADYLNDLNVVPPITYSKTKEYLSAPILDGVIWEKSTIRGIIRNKVYNGYYKYSDVKTHEAIIDDELYTRVQQRVIDRKIKSGHDYYDKNGNEFSGKVCCNVCKQAMTIETSVCKEGIVKYLRCSSYDKRGIHKYECDNKTAIRYNELRDIVDMFIEKEIFQNKDLNLNSIQTSYQVKIKDNEINNKRKNIKMEKECIDNLLEKNNIDINKLEVKSNNEYLIKYKKYSDSILFLTNRKKELEKLSKELYGFGRTVLVSNKDIFFDKYIVDSFIDKIYIDVLKDSKRDISISIK